MTEPASRKDIQRPLEECAVPDRPDALPSLRRAAPAIEDASTATAAVGTGSAATGAALARPALPLRWWRGLRTSSAHAVRATIGWARRPSGRYALPVALLAVAVTTAVSAGAVLVPRSGASGGQPLPPGAPTEVPAPPPAPTAAPPGSGTGSTPTSAPTGITSGRPPDVVRGWAQQLSTRTGISVVALQAYGYAELVVSETTPGCGLSWTTLAAIGRAESGHGGTGGATPLPDGRALPQIIGPPLDGGGDRKRILDTDGGSVDGDSTYDRAVGPMQFIPDTWQQQRVDASGDGVADPHNIHDAALAAANYLCADGRDVTTPEGWWAAVLAYNDVQSYALDVFNTANDYGSRSRE